MCPGCVLIESKLTTQKKYLLQRFFDQHKNWLVFEKSQLGQTSVSKHAIDTGNNTSFYLEPYRIPIARRKGIEDLIKEKLDQNIIRPSFSAYSSPVVLATKKDNTNRFCVDLKKLNSQTVRDVHPLPNIEDVLNALNVAKHFSVFDESSGFWQLEVVEREKEKTIFITSNMLY